MGLWMLKAVRSAQHIRRGENMTILEVKNVSKLFGPQTEQGLQLLEQGWG
ncbi:glycine/betaine ABC transporter ATP-binding protein, partial [Clostridioides difficile]